MSREKNRQTHRSAKSTVGSRILWGQEHFGVKNTLGPRVDFWNWNEVGKENLTTVIPTGSELPVQGGTGRGRDPQREEPGRGPAWGWQLGCLLVWVDQAVCCLHGHTGFTWPALGGLMKQFSVDRPQAGARPPHPAGRICSSSACHPRRHGPASTALLGPSPAHLSQGVALPTDAVTLSLKVK